MELRSLGMGGVSNPKIHDPSHMCYHVKFLSSATKKVRIYGRKPEYWGALEPPHSG